MNKNKPFTTLLFLFSTALPLLALAQESTPCESYVVKSPDNNTMLLPLNLQSTTKDGVEMRRQIKKNGYYSTYSENAASLIALKNKKAVKPFEENNDPYYKNLRNSPSEFSLSFPFYGISSVENKHLLGFAPSGTVKNKQWTGITGYFNEDNLGTCRFVTFDISVSQRQTVYDPDYTTYEINGKPTTSNTEGNDASGFIYHTSWAGKRYAKMLECANKKPLAKQSLLAIIALAKKIDNDLPDTP